MPRIPVCKPLAALAASALLGLASLCGCKGGLIPGFSEDEKVSLRTYRDSALDLDIGYPEGWVMTDKTTYGTAGRIEDVFFEPMNTLWTRRFTVKVRIPDRPEDGRTVRDFRDEYLDRLDDRGDAVRLEDTLWTTLGDREAFLARWTLVMDGKPYTRNMDYLCLKDGRDIALSFEVADEHAGADIVLYGNIAERFRFYRP